MSDIKDPNLAKLEGAIDSLLEELLVTNGDTDTYSKTADQLKKLYEIKYNIAKEADPTVPEAIEDKNRARLKDWIPVIGSIAGVLTIVTFESFGHILTSKGMAFVGKPR